MLREVILRDVSDGLEVFEQHKRLSQSQTTYFGFICALVIIVVSYARTHTSRPIDLDWLWQLLSVDHGFKVAQQDLHRLDHVSVPKRRSSPSRACLMITLM
jgi:hypothetical protein